MRKCTHCSTVGSVCGRNAGEEFPCFDQCKSCGVGDRKPCTPSCLAVADVHYKKAISWKLWPS